MFLQFLIILESQQQKLISLFLCYFQTEEFNLNFWFNELLLKSKSKANEMYFIVFLIEYLLNDSKENLNKMFISILQTITYCLQNLNIKLSDIFIIKLSLSGVQ